MNKLIGIFSGGYEHNSDDVVPVPKDFILTWDNILNVPVADPASVADWNTFFDLPTNGTPFSSVRVVGNVVHLFGGIGITIIDSLFLANSHLVRIEDNADCIVLIKNMAFSGCNHLTYVKLPAVITIETSDAFSYCTILVYVNFHSCTSIGDYAFLGTPLTVVDFSSLITAGIGCFSFNCVAPDFGNLEHAGGDCFSNSPFLVNPDFHSLKTIGNYCFASCTSFTNINLPSCTSLGTTVGDDGVFDSIVGLNITLTIPIALMTCNGGNPDGDIQYLQANNTVTIITV